MFVLVNVFFKVQKFLRSVFNFFNEKINSDFHKPLTREDLDALEGPTKWIKQTGLEDQEINSQVIYKQDNESFEDKFSNIEYKISLIDLLRKVMRVFELIIKKPTVTDLVQELQENMVQMDQIMSGIYEFESPNRNFSIRYLNYLVQVTKCHIYWHLSMRAEAEHLFHHIKKMSFKDNLDMATIQICKEKTLSVFVLNYTNESSIECFEKALSPEEGVPDSDIFNFLLAKKLRSNRRELNPFNAPGNREIECFQRAYIKSKNLTLGLFSAQTLREARGTEAVSLYKELLSEMLKNKNRGKESFDFSVYLRLAMGLMQMKLYSEARNCLDMALLIMRNKESSMYYHYEGIYFLRTMVYKENRLDRKEIAKAFLRRAGELKNYPAARHYVSILAQEEEYDKCLGFLLYIVKTHHMSDNRKQNTFCDITCVCLKLGNLQQALQFALKALEIEPANKILKDFKSVLDPKGTGKNMFETVKTILLSNDYSKYTGDEELDITIEKLRHICQI